MNFEIHFLKNLSESLDTSNINIRWIDKDKRLIGLFQIDKNVYQLDFNLVGDSWSYKFYLVEKKNNEVSLSSNKTSINTDKYKVLSTSIKGLKYLIDSKSPNAIVFCAIDGDDVKKIEVDDKLLTKRQSIYLNMLENLPDLYPDYTYDIKNIDNNQIYIVYKKLLDESDKTFDNIEKIIMNYIS
jgi:hypothetical protein